LSFNYTYWTLEDAQVKKEEYLEIQKKVFGPRIMFLFSKCSSFFTQGFLYILGYSGPPCAMATLVSDRPEFNGAIIVDSN
jgi:hypothetical protein